MKSPLHIPLLFLAAAAGLAAQETEIHCTDGSRIRGSMNGIETDRILFESDFLADPVPLRLDKILQLTLPIHRDLGKADHVATVTLSNGDVIRGELTGVDESKITISTWFADELQFRRSMVDTLEIRDRPELLYAGPNSLDEWTQTSEESWTFARDSLRSDGSGTISKDVKIPKKSSISFDLAWRTNPRFRFLFYSDDATAERPENCYELTFQSRYVRLDKHWSQGDRVGNDTVGSANVSELLSKEKCRIEILTDKTAGTIRMLVNDRIAADWVDINPPVGEFGGAVHFNSPDGTPIRVSRIDVTTWDGHLEGSAPNQMGLGWDSDDIVQPQEESTADPDRIRLRNNDMVSGKLLGIENGNVNLETPFGEVSLPVSRLRTFTLHTEEERDDWELGLYEIPKLYRGDVRAWFPDGGKITFQLEGVADGKLKGRAQPFGTAEFDQRAFSRIEFNLYDSEFDELRNFDSWD